MDVAITRGQGYCWRLSTDRLTRPEYIRYDSRQLFKGEIMAKRKTLRPKQDDSCLDRITIGVKASEDEPGVRILFSSSAAHSPSDNFSLNIGSLKEFVTQDAPTPYHRWCSGGHWSEYKNFSGYDPAQGKASKLDNYCEECRKEQQRKWRLTQAYNRLALPTSC